MTMSRRTLLSAAATGGALLLVPIRPAMAAQPVTAGRTAIWVPSWATAQTSPTASDAVALGGVSDYTLRSVLRLTTGTSTTTGGRGVSSTLRLRLAGTFSTAPIRIGAVTVARLAPGASGATPGIDPLSLVRVTFDGALEGLLPAGGTLASDPVRFRLDDAGDLVVSIHLPGPTGPLSFHRNTHATGYLAASDLTADSGSGFAGGGTWNSVALLVGVDVDRPGVASVAILGDSITEGVGTPDNTNQRFADRVASRLARQGTATGVANLGISGNRLLLDDERFGPSGLSRLDRDALALPRLDSLFVVLGVNDLQQPPSQTDPEVILDGYRELASRARRRVRRVVGATITPFGGWRRWTPALEQERLVINRTLLDGRGRMQRTGFDAVVDLASAVADPADPARLHTDFDSGDGLHPNAAGAAAMAAAVHHGVLLG